MFAKEKDCHGKRGYIVATLPYFWHNYTRSGLTFILLQFLAIFKNAQRGGSRFFLRRQCTWVMNDLADICTHKKKGYCLKQPRYTTILKTSSTHFQSCLMFFSNTNKPLSFLFCNILVVYRCKKTTEGGVHIPCIPPLDLSPTKHGIVLKLLAVQNWKKLGGRVGEADQRRVQLSYAQILNSKWLNSSKWRKLMQVQKKKKQTNEQKTNKQKPYSFLVIPNISVFSTWQDMFTRGQKLLWSYTRRYTLICVSFNCLIHIFKIISHRLHAFTPKILLVSLLTVLSTILVMLVWRICCWIDYSDQLSAWYWIDVVERYSVILSWELRGELGVKLLKTEIANCRLVK